MCDPAAIYQKHYRKLLQNNKCVASGSLEKEAGVTLQVNFESFLKRSYFALFIHIVLSKSYQVILKKYKKKLIKT